MDKVYGSAKLDGFEYSQAVIDNKVDENGRSFELMWTIYGPFTFVVQPVLLFYSVQFSTRPFYRNFVSSSLNLKDRPY